MSKEIKISLWLASALLTVFLGMMGYPRYHIWLHEKEIEHAHIEMEKAKVISEGLKEAPGYLEYIKAHGSQSQK